jgi:diguanylate cyclase (GGDEF)-like protein/PAS domain S-box-containing protein
MLLIDPQTGEIVDANPAAAAFYGYSADVLRSMRITQINTLQSEDVADLLAHARSHEQGHFVFPHRLASGEVRRVDVHSSVIGEGRRLLLSIIVDIEQRVRAEESLAESERLFRMLSENAEDAVLLVSPAGKVSWASSSIERLLGYTPAEVKSLDGASFVHPDDLAAARAAVLEGDGAGTRVQVRFRRKDGEYRWMSATSRTVTDLDGAVTGRIDALRDIHNEVLAQQKLTAAEEESRLAFDRSSVATCLVSNAGRLVRVNPAMCDLLGRSEAELLTMSFLDVTHPDDTAVGADLLRDLVAGGRSSLRLTKRYVRGDGRVVWGDLTVSAVSDVAGTVRHRIAQILDVTAEHQLRESLLEAQRIAHLGSWSLDVATGHVRWSPALYEVFGLDPRGPAPDYPDQERLVEPESWARLTAAFSLTQATGRPCLLELEMIRADGSPAWMEVRGEAVRDAAGAIVGLAGVTMDITDRRVAVDELRKLATHDPLTGLANRATLLDEVSRAISAAGRSGRAAAVLMMDLDRFKNVNDTLGHAAGDDLLVAAAARIKGVVRAGDLVARLGGDEFVVVMRDLDDPTDAVRVASRLVEEFRAPFTSAVAELYATASIGMVIATEKGDVGDLLREADTALYAAKDAGRDRVSVFNEDLRAALITRQAIEADLRHGLERGQLALWYQPEVDLATGRVLAVEALLRWHHPDGSVWTADRFIDVAEDTGLILDIGDWVLNQACAQGAAWATARPDRPITVRVNTSALQLADNGLLEALDGALTASGFDPGLLCIEITETALLRQTSAVADNLRGIHERGASLAIDDFGTGYASLTYLHQYPIDVLKIDRSFTADLTTSDHTHRLVDGIIALVTGLGITVIAEGVEHAEQASHLRQMGCPTAQGWLYAKALPQEEVTPLLDHTYPHS